MIGVYLVRAGQSQYKVGVTTNILKRIKSLQTSNSKKIELITYKQSDDARSLERRLHEYLKDHAGDGGKEWFGLTPRQALDVCVRINKEPSLTINQVDELKELIVSQRENQTVMLEKMESLVEQAQFELKQKTPKQTQQEKIVSELESEPSKVTREEQDRQDAELAMRIFRHAGKASTSLLQVTLSMGYGRAARVMHLLEEEGLISKADGSKPRQLVSQEVSSRLTTRPTE